MIAITTSSSTSVNAAGRREPGVFVAEVLKAGKGMDGLFGGENDEDIIQLTIFYERTVSDS
jgi:hypothetical protein